MSETPSCSICLNELIDNVHTTVCGHKFHDKCIKESNEVHSECPLCRTIINDKDYNSKLYFSFISDTFLLCFLIANYILMLIKRETPPNIFDNINQYKSKYMNPKNLKILSLKIYRDTYERFILKSLLLFILCSEMYAMSDILLFNIVHIFYILGSFIFDKFTIYEYGMYYFLNIVLYGLPFIFNMFILPLYNSNQYHIAKYYIMNTILLTYLYDIYKVFNSCVMIKNIFSYFIRTDKLIDFINMTSEYLKEENKTYGL